MQTRRIEESTTCICQSIHLCSYALELIQRYNINSMLIFTLLNMMHFQVFYSHRRPQHTYQSLQLVVDTLQSSEPPTGLTPSQISSTLYISRLTLARLLCLYPSSTTADKKDLALNALNDKWKVDKSQLLSLAKVCIYETMIRPLIHSIDRLVQVSPWKT